ncbi:hypothetical protein [Geodermatophilus sp. DSM 44513]|uniref:hypothetical protein n=1 Tax=Geodermatophilus sp. DSM 44513 TaxID=1528104 RepID=UPI001413357F|nr:hypothetical protein [Geodermatophilus sp. DSM 44513]WNV74449.1 hypothetical protein RTG05_15840 [Geodermatophilus sp. DSM 44513]
MSTAAAAAVAKPQPPTASAALLWDLDNVSVPLADLDALAQALCGLVPDGAPMLASANWRAFRLAGDILRAHGIRVLCGSRDPNGADGVLCGSRDPNGADGVLLKRARRLKRRGVERFIVATNDHAFARIANFAEVHVATLTSNYVSSRLRTAAASVTVLTHVGEDWRADGEPLSEDDPSRPDGMYEHLAG